MLEGNEFSNFRFNNKKIINHGGIYEIKNKQNGHLYIGSAVNFRTRWNRHKKDARQGKHHSIYFQRAWNKYGEENFEFQILLICEKSDLVRYEQSLIDIKKPEYNVAPCADHPTRGRKHTKETRKKLSESHMGYEPSEETRKKMSEASKNRGEVSEETRRKISESKTGEKNPMYGKSMSEEQKQRISKSNIGKTRSEETCKRLSKAKSGKNHPMYGRIGKDNPRSKSVLQLTKNGEFIKRYEGISEAARETGLSQGHISSVCSGERKSTGGFIWKYAE